MLSIQSRRYRDALYTGIQTDMEILLFIEFCFFFARQIYEERIAVKQHKSVFLERWLYFHTKVCNFNIEVDLNTFYKKA